MAIKAIPMGKGTMIKTFGNISFVTDTFFDFTNLKSKMKANGGIFNMIN